jgi:hypothetical protein
MLFCGDYIVSRKLWQSFVDFFRHGIGISNDGCHIQWLIEVLFQRASHWCKWGITMKQFLDNREWGVFGEQGMDEVEGPGEVGEGKGLGGFVLFLGNLGIGGGIG